jgi:hypothetical protein
MPLAASLLRAGAGLLLSTVAALSAAQPPGPPAGASAAGPQPPTRLLVTTTRIKPEMLDEWLELQRVQVVPALKKAGITERVVYQTVIGETGEFISVRPLYSFAELNGPGPLVSALGAEDAATLTAKLRACTLSQHRRIEIRQDALSLDPGEANALFASRYRALPGQSGAYMNFVRTEMFPVMQQAQKDGTFAGLSVTVSGQGGEAGLITLNMHYADFAPLDGPPPVAKTLGPEGTREFLAKGAGLITGIEQLVLRRVADLSF